MIPTRTVIAISLWPLCLSWKLISLTTFMQSEEGAFSMTNVKFKSPEIYTCIYAIYIVHVLEVCYTYAGVSAAAWFTAGDPPKDLQLRVEQLHILATEDLNWTHKVPTFPQDKGCDVQHL